MAREWKDVALEDVADELTVGYVGPMASEYVDDGVPFLRSQNVELLKRVGSLSQVGFSGRAFLPAPASLPA
jgi:hypothetical protein